LKEKIVAGEVLGLWVSSVLSNYDILLPEFQVIFPFGSRMIEVLDFANGLDLNQATEQMAIEINKIKMKTVENWKKLMSNKRRQWYRDDASR
jgi:hypothetical protein